MATLKTSPTVDLDEEGRLVAPIGPCAGLRRDDVVQPGSRPLSDESRHGWDLLRWRKRDRRHRHVGELLDSQDWAKQTVCLEAPRGCPCEIEMVAQLTQPF